MFKHKKKSKSYNYIQICGLSQLEYGFKNSWKLRIWLSESLDFRFSTVVFIYKIILLDYVVLRNHVCWLCKIFALNSQVLLNILLNYCIVNHLTLVERAVLYSLLLLWILDLDNFIDQIMCNLGSKVFALFGILLQNYTCSAYENSKCVLP